MARNRQRAKQRQAARKGADGARANEREQARTPEAVPDEQEVERAIDLETGAPPQDLGSSESTLEYEQELEAEEALEDYDPEDEQQPYDASGDNVDHQAEPTSGPRGRRGGTSEHSHRPRFVQFLIAVRAELRRVEWPTRQTLTTLTGVVLGFVLIAGGYLGLLDAVFSKLIQQII